MKILRLTLHKKAFEVMVTGEKKKEYRQPSAWIESRLYAQLPSGNKLTKSYDLIEFTNGYGAGKPRFTAKYLGFTKQPWVRESYSNGFIVEVESPTYAIHIGEIISVENYEN